jgi:aspartyl protease family protein
MSVSSGTFSLFATAAFCIASAGATAYTLKHKDEVRQLVGDYAGLRFEQTAATGQGEESASGEDGAPSGTASSDTSGDVTLRAGAGGHFETSAEINGRSIDVLVDTGATLVALTYEDAERAGIYPRASDFTHSVSTANGIAKVAPIDIDAVSIGSVTVHNVRGAVAERGKLHRTLLGMTFLSKLHVEMRKDELVLRQ